MLADSNCESLSLHLIAEQPIQKELQVEQERENIMEQYAESTWYVDIVHFLLYLQCSKHLEKKVVRSLKLKATKYCLVDQQLCRKDPGGILLRCLGKSEIEEVISKSHEGACGGHKYWKATAYKLLRSGYYWPCLFSDVYWQVRACIPCQNFSSK